MITEAIIVIILCWILASIAIPGLMGAFVAHYEDCTYERDFGHPNLHPLYVVIRATVLLPIALVIYYVCSFTMLYPNDWLIYSALFYGASLFTWPLFYNGIQYEFRKKLSEGRVYTYGFFDKKQRGYGESKNAAKWNPSFWFRLGMFIVGTSAIFTIIRVIANF